MSLTIAHPNNDDDVCNTFVAYGTQTAPSTGNVSGTMTPPGGNPINGTTIQQPTGRGTWAIQFSDVPDGIDYLLEVDDTSGGSGSSNGITVDPSYCS